MNQDSSIDTDRSASVRSLLIDEAEFLTLTKVNIGLEKTEIVFLKQNSDVLRQWQKLQFNNGLKPYLITASPTNATYDATYSSQSGLGDVFSFLKKYWGIKQLFGTTEKLCKTEKVHHHLIVWHSDLRTAFDKYPNKDKDGITCLIGGKRRWGLHIQPIDRLTSAYEYITKECKSRIFEKLKDYRMFMGWTTEELNTFKLEKKKSTIKVSKRPNANLVIED